MLHARRSTTWLSAGCALVRAGDRRRTRRRSAANDRSIEASAAAPCARRIGHAAPGRRGAAGARDGSGSELAVGPSGGAARRERRLRGRRRAPGGGRAGRLHPRLQGVALAANPDRCARPDPAPRDRARRRGRGRRDPGARRAGGRLGPRHRLRGDRRGARARLPRRRWPTGGCG